MTGEPSPRPFPVPPEYPGPVHWFIAGLSTYRWAVAVALLSSWTGFSYALWGAFGGAIAGALSGLGYGIVFGLTIDSSPARPVTIATAAAGLAAGALSGFATVALAVIVQPVALIETLASGALFCIVIVAGRAVLEPTIFHFQRYQPPTIDEARIIDPMLREIGDRMGLTTLPDIIVYEWPYLEIATALRTIIISDKCLTTAFTPGELKAVLAHELHHWRKGHTVGLWFIKVASFPMVIAYNLGAFLATGQPVRRGETSPGRSSSRLLRLVGWFFFWPAWVWVKWVITPIIMAESRNFEYEADAAAAEMGLASHLASALRKMHATQHAQTGWQAALIATHPPAKFRIQRLQPSRPDDHLFETDPNWHGWQFVKRQIGRLIYRPRP